MTDALPGNRTPSRRPRPARWRGTALTLCVVALPAQTPTPPSPPVKPPTLVPLGKAFAHLGGVVVRCLVRDDSRHMLTLGSDGDLVWWDLHERRALRWIAPPEQPVLGLFLHPTEPVALCDLAGGAVRSIDLATGAHRTLEATPAAAQRPATGDWLAGGHASTGEVVSRSGNHRIVESDHDRRRQPHEPGHYFTLAPTLWLANDGTAIEQTDTRLRLQGLRFGDRTDAHEHMGPPQQPCFTPDGGHLAILGLGAVQIVDIVGAEIARFPGTHLVRPGPAGDEFWLLTADSMRRWSATRRAAVGDAVVWPWRRLELTSDRFAGPRLRPVLVRAGQPWTETAARLPDGRFQSLRLERPLRPQEQLGLGILVNERGVDFDDGSGKAAPVLLTSLASDVKTSGRATAWRFGDDGTTTHHHVFPAPALWLARSPDGARLWVGCTDGTVHGLGATGLEPLVTASFDPPLRLAVALDDAHLLAWNGKELLRIATAGVTAAGTIDLPDGLRSVDQLVASRDGRRLALARGGEVHLLQVQ